MEDTHVEQPAGNDVDVVATLRGFPIFEGLPDALLAWLAREGTVRALPRGERLFEPDMPADEMVIVLAGTLHIERQVGTAFMGTLTLETGAISGVLPYSRMRVYQGRGQALEPSTLLLVDRAKFPEMLALSEEFGARLIGLMSDRVREIARHDQQREKLAALGTLAAGISHELNNPAAAVQRANATLRETLGRRDAAMRQLTEAGLDTGGWGRIEQVLDGIAPRNLAGRDIEPLALSAHEEALEAWLEERDIPRAWDLAPALAEAGATEEDLAAVAGCVPEASLPAAISWIGETLVVREATEIIAQSSRRIAELVQAIKGYSHMDRATEQVADVHAGLEDTLLILAHRLRDVEIQRHYDRSLPPIRMFGNTLNQVWTNLLDNAIDAMDEAGKITIRTRAEDGHIVVEIEDTGKGIPADVLPRIFEPFFTSKPQGQGTGLGLDTAWRIVTQEHAGRITATSEPGRTVFRVTLPVLTLAAGAAPPVS